MSEKNMRALPILVIVSVLMVDLISCFIVIRKGIFRS